MPAADPRRPRSSCWPDLRINLGPEGTGVPKLFRQILAVNGLERGQLKISSLENGVDLWGNYRLRTTSYGTYIVQRIHPDDLPAMLATAAAARATPQMVKLQSRVVLPNGEVRHLQVLAQPFEHANGELEYLGAVIDVSERVAHEHKLHETHSQLAHAMRVGTLGELAGSIAHEVNQPLSAIATHAQAALRWLNRPEPDTREASHSVSSKCMDRHRQQPVRLHRVFFLTCDA